jgi:hypothetical protein
VRSFNKSKLELAAPSKTLKQLVSITVMFLDVTEVLFDAYESNPNDIRQGILLRGKLSTVDLLIKVACFVKKRRCFQFKKELILTS